jgi:predicted permease
VFTLADALWWSPAPVDHPESLASVYTRRSSGKGELTDLLRRGDLRLLDQMTAIAGVAHELAADGMASDLRPRLTTEAGLELHVTAVSGNYFSILGLAIRGPGLGPDAPVPQVILSDRLFVSRFTSDSSVIGKVVQLGGATLQIAGVAPRGFRGPRNGDSTDVWMSIDALPALTVVPREFMDNLNVRAYARLRKASELRLAEEQCTSALQRPVVLTTLATNRYRLADLPLAARDAQLVWALASAALFMVVLGAGHLLRMIHLRIHRARFEFAVRVVSGATDRDNVQLILIESLAAGATAWLLAVAICHAMLRMLAAFSLPSRIAIASLSTATWRNTAVMAAVSLGVCATASLFAARDARAASTVEILRAGASRVSISPARRRFVLTVSTAATFVLVGAATLLLGTVIAAFRMPFGFAADEVIVVLVQPALAQYRAGRDGLDLDRRSADYNELVDRLASMCTVTAVAKGPLPLKQGAPTAPLSVTSEGGARVVPGVVNHVGPRYFAAAGLPLLSGRDFNRADASQAEPTVVVVNQRFADLVWPGQQALGETISIGPRNGLTVIGIAADAERHGVRRAPIAAAYVPESPAGEGKRIMFEFVARAPRADPDVVACVRTAVYATFPRAAQLAASTARERVADEMRAERLAATLVTTFAAIAFVVCLLGTFGLVSLVTESRIRESGVRIALGADPRHLVARLTADAAVPVSAGCLIGAVGLWLGLPLLRALLFGIGGTTWTLLAGTGLVIISSSMAAAWWAARPMLRIDPAALLRDESGPR